MPENGSRSHHNVGLTIAIATYGHTAALKDGSVAIDGVSAKFVEVVPINATNRRMVRDLEFDVCELAPSTYLIARTRGAPYIALPIFLMRRFHHSGFVVRPESGIGKPKDLEGKRVGVRAYSVNSAVWTRGIFMNEYGLDSSKVTWVVDHEEHVATLKLPPNVVHAPPGKSLAGMMASGELDAGLAGPAGIGPTPASGAEKSAAPHFYPELIPDAAKAEAEWFRRTGIYPLHDLVVVKTERLAANPWLAKSLFDAFVAAKAPYMARMKSGTGSAPEDERYRHLAPLVGDPLPYGIKANRASLEALVTYALQQALIPSRPAMTDLFVDPDAS